MTTLQTIETKLNEMIEQNESSIKVTRQELEKSNQQILNAQTKMIQAQKEINASKYTEAKTELWTAEQTKEFHEKQLENLKYSPAISYDEYHGMIDEIIKLADQQQETFFNPAIEKIKEIIKIGEKAYEETEKVNNLLKKLESLSKNSEEYKKTKDGALISSCYFGLSYSPKKSLYGYQNNFEDIIIKFNNN